MKLPKSARGVALEILGSRKASPGVDLNLSQLDDRDRALVKELVSGTERWKRLLDYYISCFSHRPIRKLSPRVANALRLGVYQILIMGIPSYAAVDSVVECMGSKGSRGFVNGVLRNISRNLGHIELPSLDAAPTHYASIRYSYPDWIVDCYFKTFGMQDALSLLRVQNRPSPLTLRVNTALVERDSLVRMFQEEGFSAQPGMLDISMKVSRGRSITKFPGYNEGLFSVQNEGAMIATLALDPEPGDTVWDMCAAPGGKSTHIAQIVSKNGLVVATDVDKQRADMISKSCMRLKLDNVTHAVVDATNINEVADVFKQEGLPLQYDKILVDAPCSGLGVIGKNPDIKWRRRKSDIPKMAERQALLLSTAAHFLKPGGWLVYSTCTLTYEENQEVWHGFLNNHKFIPAALDENLFPFSAMGINTCRSHGYMYLLPHIHRTDGFFIAKALKQ